MHHITFVLLCVAGGAIAGVAIAKITAPQFSCEDGVSAAGQVVDVKVATPVYVDSRSQAQLLNRKTTEIMGPVFYHQIDQSTRVEVQCLSGNKARVRIVSPTAERILALRAEVGHC